MVNKMISDQSQSYLGMSVRSIGSFRTDWTEFIESHSINSDFKTKIEPNYAQTDPNQTKPKYFDLVGSVTK